VTLRQVSDYTGQPEMQGGLVKTLDFKIYLGLLSETDNAAHRADLERTGAAVIDMVVANLYPFEQTVAAARATLEDARANIDIGGPCMVRAAAKNFHRVAVLTDPSDYPAVTDELARQHGTLGLATRYRLAQKAFRLIARYDAAIADYLDSAPLPTGSGIYTIRNGA
jgi:phosphoribosylaminoimidazolecarboxamide formyltransferase/IMP cyclohydrolase